MTETHVTADDAAAYLQLLGVEPGPPSVEQLAAIHRAQVERVPYETTWIHLGETWDVDPAPRSAASSETAGVGTATT